MTTCSRPYRRSSPRHTAWPAVIVTYKYSRAANTSGSRNRALKPTAPTRWSRLLSHVTYWPSADVILAAMNSFVLDEALAGAPGINGARGRAVKGRKLGKRTEEMR